MLRKYALIFLLFLQIIYANEYIDFNAKSMNIQKLIELTVKINNISILSNYSIKAKISFVSKKKILKTKLLSILKQSLEDKGYKLVKKKNIYEIIKLKKTHKFTRLAIIKIKNIQVKELRLALLKDLNQSLDKKELKNISILIDEKNNTLLINANNDVIKYLKIYIKQIDKKSPNFKEVIKIVSLKNIEAKNALKILNSLLKSKVFKVPYKKPLFSSDKESNSIILLGQKEEISKLLVLLKHLDLPKPQVYVQAKIIEISQRKIKRIGIKYRLVGFDNNFGVFSANLGGELLKRTDISKYLGKNSNVSSLLGISIALDLLKKDQAVNIISEPSILCVNNEESYIYVGETKSFQTGTTTASSGTTASFRREDIGLSLRVRPRISSNSKVTLDILAKLEGIKQNSSDEQNPDTSKKVVKTISIVNSGQAAILGGLIKTNRDLIQTKVPFFGDIPLIGSLFRDKLEVNDKVNLLIIITPFIVPTSADLSKLRLKLARLKKLENIYTKKLIKIIDSNKTKP